MDIHTSGIGKMMRDMAKVQERNEKEEGEKRERTM